MEDIHPAVQEPLIPASVPALVMTPVMTPVIALAIRRTPPPITNQAQAGGTVVVGLLNIHPGDGTLHHLHHHHQHRDRQNRNHQV